MVPICMSRTRGASVVCLIGLGPRGRSWEGFLGSVCICQMASSSVFRQRMESFPDIQNSHSDSQSFKLLCKVQHTMKKFCINLSIAIYSGPGHPSPSIIFTTFEALSMLSVHISLSFSRRCIPLYFFQLFCVLLFFSSSSSLHAFMLYINI